MSDIPDPLDFLVGSPRRVELLDAVRGGRSGPDELRAVLDVSRTTVWRILNGLEERGWIDQSDEQIRLTAKGRVIADAYDDLRTRMRAIERLDDLLEHLPTAEMDFGIEHLADAEIARPNPNDPMAPMRLAQRLVADGQTVTMLSQAWDPGVLTVVSDRLGTASLSITMIVTEDVLSAIAADPESARRAREVLNVMPNAFRRYPGDIPYILAVIDGERVGLGVADEQGRPQAVLASEDDTVVAWAERIVECYRRESEPVDPIRFNG